MFSFFSPSRLIFLVSCILFRQIILKYKMQMVNNFKIFFIIWKTRDSTLWHVLWKNYFWVQELLEFRPKRFRLNARVEKGYRGFIFQITKRTKKWRNNFKFKRFSSKYKTLFKILCWNICRLVSRVTGCGIRYINSHLISLFWKSFSKHICDVDLE